MSSRTGKPRDVAKERFWRRTLSHQARSGLSVAAYCQREGLTPHTFRWWRQELARRDREVPTDRTDPTPSTELVISSAFLPVRVVPDEPERTPDMTPVEIVLPAGPTVRVTRGFDRPTLEAVLAVLEVHRC